MPCLHAADPSLPTLTNFPQILSLGLAGVREAAYPVRVQGVIVSLPRDTRELMYLSDGTNGLGARLRTFLGRPHLPFGAPRIGDWIELEGETAAGSSHPFVAGATARRLGPGQFPVALETRGRQIAAGRHHGAMVTLRAAVLDVSLVRGHPDLMLSADGFGFLAMSSERSDHLPVEMLNATIELQGMPWLQFDGAGKPAGFKMLVSSNAWARVLKPGFSNLFAGPRRTIASLTNAPLADDRFVVSGVVTYSWPGHFTVVADDTGAASCFPLHPIPRTNRDGDYVPRPPEPVLRCGDRVVLVASKITHRAYAPRLDNFESRVVGREEPGRPPLITEAEALTGRYDCRPARIVGRIVDRDAYEQFGAKVSRLWIKTGEQTTYALFAGSNHVEFAAPTGSRVELTGVCFVSAGTERPVRSFSLHLNSADEVRVIPDPPIWRSEAFLRVGAVAGGVLALGLVWIWLLRRQVSLRTAELRLANAQLKAEAGERARTEADRAERLKLTALNAGIAVTLNEASEPSSMLQGCAALLVQHLDAAFARIWILDDATQTLELRASAGLYTHLDGPHSRVPIGRYKIGLIAQERLPHLTNEVSADPRVSDKDWARREGMVAFAGYPLMLEGRVLGVVALFARHTLGAETLAALGSVAHSLALGFERKRAETRLRQSEERFGKAFQANPALMALTRLADGCFIAANEAFYNTTGYSESEVLGRRAADLNIYAVPEQRAEYVDLIRRKGFVRDREHVLRTKSGAIRTVLSSGELLDLNGQPHLLTVGLDITGRKEAEVELARALAREKELSELKTNFVSMVSHEFRTPLEVIVSSADILDRYLNRLPAPERAEHVAAIQHSVKRMSGMMEDVLLLGRFESDRQQFTPDDLHLTAFCRRLADEMRSATAGRCPIELTLDDSLPLARADEKLLRPILINLLSNAVKYSPAGAPVRLGLTRDAHAAVFVISDSGLGIPASDQTHLFEAFHRGANTAQIPGTGLGLVIVKRSVELHGGRIEFTSEEGKGTSFTVRLPVFNPTET